MSGSEPKNLSVSSSTGSSSDESVSSSTGSSRRKNIVDDQTNPSEAATAKDGTGKAEDAATKDVDNKKGTEDDEKEDLNEKPSAPVRITIPRADDLASLLSVNLRTDDRIKFSWSKITVSTRPGLKMCGLRGKTPKKEILKEVSGVVRPGEILAIMGADGSGKSTLLNTLLFRNMGKLEVSGTRIANNALVTPNNLTALSGYVQQDDLFILGLTVREHLCFQAMVRMHCGLSKEEKWERVEEVLDELELRDVQHTLISSASNEVEGISGGEKKRLSFACEVLTSPSLLFCDEPTSGLDSHMASSVIDVMVKLAEQGRTVLTTIHQPSSLIFSKMDQLMLMSEGRTIYLGPASNALLFFNKCGFECPSNYNPADFFIDALAINPADPERSRKKVEKIATKFKESRVGIDLDNEIENDLKYLALSEETVSRSPYKVSWATQFIALCWRNATNVRRGGWIVLVRVLTNMLTAISFGSLYMGIDSSTLSGAVSINGGLFLLVAVLAFSNIFLTINVFNPEIKIFFREHFSGMYRVDTFYLAKVIIDLPISLVSNIAFLLVFYALLGLSWVKFPVVLVIVICTVISVSSFGFMIASIVATVDVGLALTPMMVMPLMLLGGLFISINALPPYTKPVRFISFFFFAFEALTSNQWEDTQGISLHCPKNFSITANITDCGTVDGAELLHQQGLEMGHKWIDAGALLVLAILFQIIGFIGLSIRARKR